MLTLEELRLGLEAARAQVDRGHVTTLINPRKLVDLYEMALRAPEWLRVYDDGYADGSCSVEDTRTGTILATFFKDQTP